MITKKQIVEILEKVDELHKDGFALKEYLDKLADQILFLFSQSQAEQVKAIKEELETIRFLLSGYDKSKEVRDRIIDVEIKNGKTKEKMAIAGIDQVLSILKKRQ